MHFRLGRQRCLWEPTAWFVWRCVGADDPLLTLLWWELLLVQQVNFCTISGQNLPPPGTGAERAKAYCSTSFWCRFALSRKGKSNKKSIKSWVRGTSSWHGMNASRTAGGFSFCVLHGGMCWQQPLTSSGPKFTENWLGPCTPFIQSSWIWWVEIPVLCTEWITGTVCASLEGLLISY